MTAPNITIWTPVYNHAEFLPRCIESVINQEIRPLEYLILDDASTDESLAIAQSYAEKHSWIRIVPNKVNKGAIANFNRIFDLAAGDYLYTVASDDYTSPESLRHFKEAAANWPQAGILCSQMAMVTPEGHTFQIEKVPQWTQTSYHSPEECLQDYYLKAPAHHSMGGATVYRKTSAKATGRYRQELGHWADTFMSRAIAFEEGMVHIPEPLHAWTSRPDSLSGSQLQNPKTSLDVIARAAWLMRSEQFRDRFPEEYVKYWEQGYREHVLQPILDGYEHLNRERNLWFFATLSPDKPGHKLLGRLFSLFLKLEDRLFTRHYRNHVESLRDYAGDLSCYETGT